jgi:uncharacterized membrane protein
MTQHEGSSRTGGLAENVAGLLCYVLGWLTGIIFLLIDNRPWVRFHAAQSVVVFGGLSVIRIALIFSSGLIGGMLGYGVLSMLGSVIALVTLILWIVLMIKAYQHETFKVPIASEIAERIAGK